MAIQDAKIIRKDDGTIHIEEPVYLTNSQVKELYWSEAEKFKNKYGDKLPLACSMFIDGDKQKDIAKAIGVKDPIISSKIKPWLLGFFESFPNSLIKS